jgi:hypothetical protein
MRSTAISETRNQYITSFSFDRKKEQIQVRAENLGALLSEDDYQSSVMQIVGQVDQHINFTEGPPPHKKFPIFCNP